MGLDYKDKVYRQIVVTRIPLGTNCAPLVADILLFCYEKTCMTNCVINAMTLILIL